MKSQRLTLAMCVLNAILLFLLAAQPRQQAFEKISVKEFEVVDNKGIPRFTVTTTGDETNEVVLRMKDQKGTIRVKMGASQDGSGLVLLNNDTEVGFHALAKAKGTTLTLVDKSGKKREY